MSEVAAYTLGSPMLAPLASAGISPQGSGKTIGEINQELEDWALVQPSVTGCAWCDWTFEGTVAEGQQASRDHRAEAHGVTGPGRRRMRGFGSGKKRKSGIVIGNNDLIANVAKVRAQGGAGWVSNETEELKASVREERADEISVVDEIDADMDALEVESDDDIAAEPEPEPHHNGIVMAPRVGRGIARWTRESVISAIQVWAAENGRPPKQVDAKGDPSLPSPSVARTACGGWADAVEQAGFPRPTKGDNRKAWETRRARIAAAATVEVPPPVPPAAKPNGKVLVNAPVTIVELAELLHDLDAQIAGLQRARAEVAAAMRERIGDA